MLFFGCQNSNKLREGAELPSDTKINEIQVLGTHNSYALPVDSVLLRYGSSLFEELKYRFLGTMSESERDFYREYHPNEVTMEDGLRYNHPDFITQLDCGVRSLEVDVYYDPSGGRFDKPAGYEFLKSKGIRELAAFNTEGLDKPGFKVLHIADFDFRTHYPTLEQALLALKTWSDRHPDHIPIFVMVEAKDKGISLFPNSAEVLPFDREAFDALDREIIDILGKDKLITPDQVRGTYSTLREAVLAKNWPTVEESRGKMVFLLLPTGAGIGAGTSPYVEGSPNLEDRVMFVQSQPDDSFGAFLLLDNAIVRQQDIQTYVKQGYLVRTRADIETYEAKINDLTRAEAAFSSGAQIISTDFFDRRGNTFGTDYFVEIPEGNPVRLNSIAREE